jgi:hypothetical protein
MKNRRDRTDFINDTKNIVRAANDMFSTKRTQKTPPPDVIVAKIMSILENPRWKGYAPEKAMKELQSLLIHAEKGCLRYHKLCVCNMELSHGSKNFHLGVFTKSRHCFNERFYTCVQKLSMW